MLILARKEQQRFWIGPDICITVIEGGRKVRIGIAAPKEVAIVRQELISQDDPRYTPLDNNDVPLNQ